MNKVDLTSRLTDLFGHRSLASALFVDAEDFADSLIEHLSDYDGDDIYHNVAECIEFALGRKMDSVRDDPRYGEITNGLIGAVGDSVEKSDTPAEMKASLEKNEGWADFVEYMREKTPLNGFAELAIGHLDAISEQAIALKQNELKLVSRTGGGRAIGRSTLLSLAQLTEAGTEVELKELATTVTKIYTLNHN